VHALQNCKLHVARWCMVNRTSDIRDSIIMLHAHIYTHTYTHTYMCTALQTGRSRVRSPIESLEFFSDLIFLSHCGPVVDSASNRNEYQDYFLGVKTAGA
jgi:hypothetical protein